MITLTQLLCICNVGTVPFFLSFFIKKFPLLSEAKMSSQLRPNDACSSFV